MLHIEPWVLCADKFWKLQSSFVSSNFWQLFNRRKKHSTPFQMSWKQVSISYRSLCRKGARFLCKMCPADFSVDRWSRHPESEKREKAMTVQQDQQKHRERDNNVTTWIMEALKEHTPPQRLSNSNFWSLYCTSLRRVHCLDFFATFFFLEKTKTITYSISYSISV